MDGFHEITPTNNPTMRTCSLSYGTHVCVKGNAYFTELRSPFPLLAAASDEDEAALLLPEKEGE